MPPARSSAAIAAKSAGLPEPATAEPAARAHDRAGATDVIAADLCVIGAGPGGLSIAAIAAGLGQRVVLIEKHKQGGDSLNYGGVPSKALIAAARRAHQMRTADAFGISPVHPAIDFGAINSHVRATIAAIAPNTSVERFAGLGVRVVAGSARFIDKATVEAGDQRIKARRFVIATGSSPFVPNIPGLDAAPWFSNATIFDNTRRIDRLIVIGGGSTGLELAQAYHRLGSVVTVLEAKTALADEDPEMVAIALRRLRADGIDIRENVSVERVEAVQGGIRVHIEWNGATASLEGSHLLLATGRKPNIADLNLAAAGLKTGPKGISVDGSLKTSNRRVFAVGDVTGAPRSTQAAEYHAETVVKRALFRVRSKVDHALVPRVTFIDPELASVGLSEAEAADKNGRIKVLRWPYAENHRAQAERTPEGHVKVIVGKDGRILGASIFGAQAGELIQMWALAVSQGLQIGAMTKWIAPYPTLGDINRRVAQRSLAASAGHPFVRWLVRVLGRVG